VKLFKKKDLYVNIFVGSKRSQGYPGGTNLAQVVKQADRARIAVGRQSSRLI